MELNLWPAGRTRDGFFSGSGRHDVLNHKFSEL